MSKAKELSKSIGSNLSAQVLGLAFSILFLAYFARTLPKSEMAIYAFMATMVSWVELFRMGFPTLTLREVPGLKAEGRDGDAHRMISSTLFYCTLAAIAVSAAIALLAPHLAHWLSGSHTYVVEFKILAVVALTHGVVGILSLIQEALQRFHMRAVCQTIMNVGGRALAWAVFLRFGFHGFLWSFAAVNMLVLLLQLWSIRRDLTLKILSFGGMIRRSRVYIGVNVLRNLTVNLDRPVVAFALGDVALADYYVAKRLFDVVRTMSRAVISPPGVKLSEAQTEGCAAVQNYFRTSMSLMTFLLIPIGFAMIGMGGPILSLVAGNNYASGSAILMCFGIAIMAQAVSQTWWHAVFRLTEAHYLFVFTALMAVVTLALYFALLPWLGPVGIPLSYASACVAASIYSTLLLRRDRNITVPLSFYGRAFACGLLVLAAIALARVLEEDFLGYVAMISAAGASYVLGFLLFAPPSLRNLAQRALRGLPMLRKTTP